MTAPRVRVAWSMRQAVPKRVEPWSLDARATLKVGYWAVREIVTTRRRDIQRTAMIASTNGADVR